MANCTATPLVEAVGHSSDDKGVETATRGWRIVCDDVPTFEELVAAAEVDRFHPHPQHAYLIARGHTLKPVERDPLVWDLVWTYSNAPLELTGDITASGQMGQPPSKSQTQSGNAASRLPVVSLSRREVMVPVTHDAITGDPIAYTTGEPIDPPIERRKSLITVTINYKTVQLDVPHIVSYFDRVNDSAWKGFAQWTLLVTDFQAKTVYETHEGQILAMIDASVTLDHDPDTHKAVVLNKGRRKKETAYIRNEVGAVTGTQEVWVAITDDAGVPVTDPVPLKADGTRAMTAAQFHYLHWHRYKQANFNNLLK